MNKLDNINDMMNEAINRASAFDQWKHAFNFGGISYDERVELINSPEYKAHIRNQYVHSVETPEGTIVCAASNVQGGYNWKFKFTIIPVGQTKRKQFSKAKANAILSAYQQNETK
jgi:hypothetical protein|tara:strand:+ start:4010 stop:4354 length:345 start_codon:yes stop_codon:yes gene_type:complete